MVRLSRNVALRLVLAGSLLVLSVLLPATALNGAAGSLWIVGLFVLILTVFEEVRPADTSPDGNASGSDTPYFLIENLGVSGIALGLLFSPLAAALPPSPVHSRQPPKDCIHHSDRGSQYAAEDYRAELEKHGLKGSMGRRGNPYDNAKAESFMKTLKSRRCT